MLLESEGSGQVPVCNGMFIETLSHVTILQHFAPTRPC